MSRLEPPVKSAAEKITDPKACGVEEKPYRTMQKAVGDGNAAENKILGAKDVSVIFKTALGDKASGEEFDTVGLHFAGLAVTVTNMRQFVAAMWKSELGLGPFDSGTEDIRGLKEVAAKPKKKKKRIEEKDAEGVNLCKGSFLLGERHAHTAPQAQRAEERCKKHERAVRCVPGSKPETFKGVKGTSSPCSWISTRRRRRTSCSATR